MEELNGEAWILSPDGEKAVCVSNGMLPGHPSQIFIRYKEDKPYTVYREYGAQSIAGWIDDDHFVYYREDYYPVLMHLERNETEEVPREKCDYDTYGVKYYIKGNNLIAQPYYDEPYQWQILEKDGEIYAGAVRPEIRDIFWDLLWHHYRDDEELERIKDMPFPETEEAQIELAAVFGYIIIRDVGGEWVKVADAPRLEIRTV